MDRKIDIKRDELHEKIRGLELDELSNLLKAKNIDHRAIYIANDTLFLETEKGALSKDSILDILDKVGDKDIQAVKIARGERLLGIGATADAIRFIANKLGVYSELLEFLENRNYEP